MVFIHCFSGYSPAGFQSSMNFYEKQKVLIKSILKAGSIYMFPMRKMLFPTMKLDLFPANRSLHLIFMFAL